MNQQPGEQNGKVCTEWDRLFSDFEAAILFGRGATGVAAVAPGCVGIFKKKLC
jgi:hypothetical protein